MIKIKRGKKIMIKKTRIYRQKQWQKKRKQEGKCIICGHLKDNAYKEKVLCKECSIRRAERYFKTSTHRPYVPGKAGRPRKYI